MLSTNAISLVVFLLAYIGFEVSDADVVQFAAALVQVITFGRLLFNQFARRDTTWFFWKK